MRFESLIAFMTRDKNGIYTYWMNAIIAAAVVADSCLTNHPASNLLYWANSSHPIHPARWAMDRNAWIDDDYLHRHRYYHVTRRRHAHHQPQIDPAVVAAAASAGVARPKHCRRCSWSLCWVSRIAHSCYPSVWPSLRIQWTWLGIEWLLSGESGGVILHYMAVWSIGVARRRGLLQLVCHSRPPRSLNFREKFHDDLNFGNGGCLPSNQKQNYSLSLGRGLAKTTARWSSSLARYREVLGP